MLVYLEPGGSSNRERMSESSVAVEDATGHLLCERRSADWI